MKEDETNFPSWRDVIGILKHSERSDHAFASHLNYIYVNDVEALSPNETTPLSQSYTPIFDVPPEATFHRTMIYAIVLAGIISFSDGYAYLFPGVYRYDLQVDALDDDKTRLNFFNINYFLGGILGCFLTSRLADEFGRLTTVEFATVPSIVGWLMVSFCIGQGTLLMGRWMTGVASGVFSVAIPIYLAEISSSTLRGQILSLSQLPFLFGSISCVLIGKIVSWRTLAILGVLPGCFLLVGLEYLPDSPTWLLLRLHNQRDALNCLNRLYTESFQAKLRLRTIQEAGKLGNESKPWPKLVMPLIICSCMVIVKTILFSCIHAISSLQMIRQKGEFGVDNTQVGSSLLLFFIQFLGCILCVALIDKKGRVKTIQIASGCGCVGGLAYLLLQQFQVESQMDLTCCLLLLDFAYWLGFAILPILFAAELFPVKFRVISVSIVVLIEWLFKIGMTTVLTYVDQQHHHYDVLFVWICCVFFLISLGSAHFILPETQDKSLEEIEAVLSGWKAVTPRAGEIHGI